MNSLFISSSSMHGAGYDRDPFLYKTDQASGRVSIEAFPSAKTRRAPVKLVLRDKGYTADEVLRYTAENPNPEPSFLMPEATRFRSYAVLMRVAQNPIHPNCRADETTANILVRFDQEYALWPLNTQIEQFEREKRRLKHSSAFTSSRIHAKSERIEKLHNESSELLEIICEQEANDDVLSPEEQKYETVLQKLKELDAGKKEQEQKLINITLYLKKVRENLEKMKQDRENLWAIGWQDQMAQLPSVHQLMVSHNLLKLLKTYEFGRRKRIYEDEQAVRAEMFKNFSQAIHEEPLLPTTPRPALTPKTSSQSNSLTTSPEKPKQKAVIERGGLSAKRKAELRRL